MRSDNSFGQFRDDVRLKFCCFLDMQGTRSRLRNFEDALDFYHRASLAIRDMPEFKRTDIMEEGEAPVSYSMVSDSFVVSSKKLGWTTAVVFRVAQTAALVGSPCEGPFLMDDISSGSKHRITFF